MIIRAGNKPLIVRWKEAGKNYSGSSGGEMGSDSSGPYDEVTLVPHQEYEIPDDAQIVDTKPGDEG